MRNIIILIALYFASLSCSNLKENQNPVQHEHAGEDMHQFTLFTDSTEFYVEFSGISAGQQEEFLVHLTRLSDYKPYAEGKVTVTLDFGNNKTSGFAGSPEIQGIWHIDISPEYTGNCNIEIEYASETYSEKTVFIGEKMEDDPQGITFTREQAWRSDFKVSILKPSSFNGIIKAGGEILPMPGEKYYINARTPGIVNYKKKDLVAGGEIRRGEEMMSIEGQDLAMGNIAVEFADAETRFRQRRKEYERRLALMRENAISEKLFIETRSDYITDSIRYYNLLQSYSQGGLIIASPITGHIHELNVSQGEYVEAGQLIATVSSDQKLLLRADVPQQFYSEIGNIVSANIRTSYHKKPIDIETLGGRLLAIGSSVKENNQYLPVYFEAVNNGDLLEGAYAEFFLKTRTIENCLLIPVQSLLEEQGRYYVYVQLGGQTYQKREVRPGESDGFNYRVISGISAGERIVTKGSMLIKAASMSSSIPSDSHQH